MPGVTHFYFYSPYNEKFIEVDKLPDSFTLYFSGTYLIKIGTSPKTIYVSSRAIIIIIRNDVQTDYQKIISEVHAIYFPAGNEDSYVQLIYADCFDPDLWDIIHNPKDLEVSYFHSPTAVTFYSDSTMFVSVENLCEGDKDEWLIPKNEAFIFRFLGNDQYIIKANSLDTSLKPEIIDHPYDKRITNLEDDMKYPYEVCRQLGIYTSFCNISTKQTYVCGSPAILNPSLFNVIDSQLVSSKSGTHELIAITRGYEDYFVFIEYGTFKNKYAGNRFAENKQVMALSTIPIRCTSKENELEVENENGLYSCTTTNGLNLNVLKANSDDNITKSFDINTNTDNIVKINDVIYLYKGFYNLEINGTLTVSCKGALYIPDMTDLEIISSSVAPKDEGYYFDRNEITIQLKSNKLVKFKIFCSKDSYYPSGICYNVPSGIYKSPDIYIISDFQFHLYNSNDTIYYYHVDSIADIRNDKLPLDYKYKCVGGATLEKLSFNFSEELTTNNTINEYYMKPGKEYIYNSSHCAFITDETEEVYIAGNSEKEKFTKLDPTQFYEFSNGFKLKYDGPREKIRVLVQCTSGGYFTGYEKEQTKNGVPLKPILTSTQELYAIKRSNKTTRVYFFDNNSIEYFNEIEEKIIHIYYGSLPFVDDYIISNYQDYPQYIIDGNNTIDLSKNSNFLGIIIGCVTAAVVVIIVIIVAIVCAVKKKKNAQVHQASSSSSSSKVSQQANNP